MMPSKFFPVVIALAVLLLLAVTSLFTVSENQLAIRTEFGRIVDSHYAPGLHWKWPWDRVVKFERRIMSQSHEGETFLTNDNRALIVDFYIKWRIANAVQYFKATGGKEDIAGERLSEIVNNGLKSVVAQHSLQQIVRSERSSVTGEMFPAASRTVAGLGIKLIDVRVERIDLPEDVASRVYQSMEQNFAKIASRLRAEGSAQAVSIRAEAERKRTVIVADANRDALRVRGAADEKAAEIYAKAYARDPEFYAFYRSLRAYRKSIGKKGDVLVISPDGDFFKYLKSPAKR